MRRPCLHCLIRDPLVWLAVAQLLVIVLLWPVTARAQDAGLPRALVLAPSRLSLPDGGELEVPGGTCWLRADTCLEAGQRAAGQTAENAALRAAVPQWTENSWVKFFGGAAAATILTTACFKLTVPK
jgi:hypothetical protein